MPGKGERQNHLIFALVATAVVFVSFSVFADTDDSLLEPRMSMEERVAKAELIVIGRIGPPGNLGKHTTTSVVVEERVFGLFPTNTTLFVSYSASGWLIPEIASRTHVPKPNSRWIFFLTTEGLTQDRRTNYLTRAVGPSWYAHDGLEFATEEVVKRVRAMVNTKKQERERRDSVAKP